MLPDFFIFLISTLAATMWAADGEAIVNRRMTMFIDFFVPGTRRPVSPGLR